GLPGLQLGDGCTFCNRETNHDFGVKLSTFYLLIFTLSVVGNSLVLYILCKLSGYVEGATPSSAAVWGISLMACIKPFLLYNQAEHYSQGLRLVPQNRLTEVLKLSGRYLQLGLFFLFPLIVVFYCYIRICLTVIASRMTSKYRTVRLIFVIVLLFFACWTPYNVVVMLQADEVDCVKDCKLDYALQVNRMVTYLYFCINPAFYTFVGRKFQNHFWILLQKHMPCLKNHVSINGSRTLSHIRNLQVGMTSQTDVQHIFMGSGVLVKLDTI
ncbi:unnamed protein product, partial [Coregonus sp. 'balchen']